MSGFRLGLCVGALLLCCIVSTHGQSCDVLGVTVTETAIDDTVHTILWAGPTSQVVFVHTHNYSIYRSEDEGKTWVNQYPALQQSIRGIVPSNANNSNLYLFGFGPQWDLWTSKDIGKTWQMAASTGIRNSLVVSYVSTHPKLWNWVAVGGWSGACYVIDTGNCHYDVYYSNNFGETFTLIDTYVTDFYWGKTTIDPAVGTPSSILLFYTTTDDKTGNQDWNIKTPNLQRVDLVNPLNNGLVFTTTEWIYKYPHNDSLIFASERDPVLGGVNLMVSEDDGETWQQGTFPFEELPENGYSLLDGSEGTVLVNVQHGQGVDYGNVYASDAFASDYSLILKNNRRLGFMDSFWAWCDFVKMESLNGIFMANIYEDGPDLIPTSNVVTELTFDLGGKWRRLTPPTVDSNGQPITCVPGEECNLHLNGILENTMGRFYSVPGAVGIVLGTGNVGPHLAASWDAMNTYMSRDAGWSWVELAKGTHVYEIADHGGLIVMATDTSATENLLFTWNQGLTTTQCQFTSNGAADIYNIVVEPDFGSQQFVMYGYRNGQGLLVHLDFSGLHTATCRNPETPGQPDSDYELWSPMETNTTDVSKQCLLGRHIQYTRRKRDAACFDPLEYEPTSKVEQCPCIIDDYECDYCFEADKTGKCVWSCPFPQNTGSPSVCNDFYYVSQGYRLITGDGCNYNTGLNLLPNKMQCPTTTTGAAINSGSVEHHYTGGAVAGIVVGSLVGLLCIVGAVISFRLKKPAFIWKSGNSTTGYNQVSNFEPEYEDTEHQTDNTIN